MTKRAKWLIVGVVMAVVLALSIGAVAYAAGPVNSNGCGLQFGACDDVVSKLTGLTTAEIQALRQEGKSLVEIAATKGVTEAQLVEAIIADKKALLQERVTAGTLSQEQADLMLKNMEQNTIRAVNRTTTGPNGGACGLGAGTCGAAQYGTQNAVRGGCGGAGTGMGAGMMRGFGRAR